jgi:hypothetical protein
MLPSFSRLIPYQEWCCGTLRPDRSRTPARRGRPTRYRINATLADKGVRIREWLGVKNEYRCFYDHNNHDEISILLYASMKEDFEPALYRDSVIY